MAAVVARHRLLRDEAKEQGELSSDVVAADKKCMKDKASSWRPKVLPLTSNDATMKSQTRKQTRGEIRVHSSSTTSSMQAEYEMDDDLILIRPAYHKHQEEESGDDEATADVKFDELLKKQGNKYFRGGKDRVRIQNPCSKIRHVKGIEQRDGVGMVSDIDSAQESLLRQQISKTFYDQRARSASPSQSRSASPPAKRLCSTPRASDRTARMRSKGPSSDEIAVARSRRSRSKDDESPVRPKKKSHGEGAALAVKKDVLAKEIKDVMLTIAGKPSSMKASLDKVLEDLARRGGSERDCPHKSADLQSDVKDLLSEGDKITAKIDECTPSSIEKVQTAVDKFGQSVESTRKRVQAQCEAVSYKLSVKVNEKRSQYQKSYWQVTKVSQHLTDGCFSSALAKLLAEYITRFAVGIDDPSVKVEYEGEKLKIDIPWSEFSGESVCLWHHDAAVCVDLKRLIFPDGPQATAFAAKQDSLVDYLDGRPKYHGTVGDVSCSLDYSRLGLPKDLMKFTGADHEGCKPFVLCMKQNYKRSGPLAVPSPGPPCILTASKAVVVHSCPVGEVIIQGCPVTNYEHFVSTPEGQKTVKSLSATVLLQPSSFLYIPAGHIVFLTYYKAPEKKRAKDQTLDMACASITPLPMTKMLESLSSGTKSALMQWHHDQTKEKTSSMWQQRTGFLKVVMPTGD